MNRIRRGIIACLLCSLILAVNAAESGGQLDTSRWPAGVALRADLDAARARQFDFSGISTSTLQRWLQFANIDLPVRLDGDLNGWIWVQRSSESWFDLSGYRLEGAIGSAELMIDDWVISQADVRFGYIQGDWYVGRISGELASTQDRNPIGLLDGQARIVAAKNMELQIGAAISHIDLRRLLQAFGIEFDIANAAGSLRFLGSTPLANAVSLDHWAATATLKLPNVRLPQLRSPASLQCSVELADGAWQLMDSMLAIAGQKLTLTGSGSLVDSVPFRWSLDGSDVELAALLEPSRLPLPIQKIGGSLDVAVTMSGDADVGVDCADVDLTAPTMHVDELPINGVRVQGRYRADEIRMEIEAAEVADGHVSGSSRWRNIAELRAGVPSQASFQIKQVRLDQLQRVEAASPFNGSGRATGHFRLETINRPGRDPWESTGQLQVESLEFFGVQLGDTALQWNKEPDADRMRTLIKLEQNGGRLQAKAWVRFQDRPDSGLAATRIADYSATGSLEDYQIAMSPDLPRSPRLSGCIDGVFEIHGGPGNWWERGHFDLGNSRINLDDLSFELRGAEAQFDAQAFRLKRFDVAGPAGRVHGDAIWKRDGVGRHAIRGHLEDGQLGAVLKPLAIASLETLDGSVNLQFELTQDASADSPLQDWDGLAQASLSNLTYRRRPVGDLDIQAQITDRMATGRLEGQLLAGSTRGTFVLPLSLIARDASPAPRPMEAQIQIDRAQLEAVAGWFLKPGDVRRLAGSITISAKAKADSWQQIAGEAEVKLPLIRLQQRAIARDLVVQTRIARSQLQLQRLSGKFAQGSIEATGFIGFDEMSGQIGQSEIRFNARRLDLNQLASAVAPEFGTYVDGQLNYRGTWFFQEGLQTQGTAVIRDATLFRIPVQEISGAVRARFDGQGTFRQLIARDLHGRGVGGNFRGDVAIQARDRWSMQANGRLDSGRLEELSQALGFPRIVGRGQFDADVKLQSVNLASLKDLTGSLHVDLRNGDAGSVPVLSSLDRFLPLMQFASSDFSKGRLRGWIGQGQLRIRDLVLNGDAFSLLASGSAAIDGTNLNIDAILRTGGGVQQQVLQSAVERLLVGVAPPVSVINQINEIVRNRSLFFHVGGRPSRPVIQTRTGPTAVKAFLQNFARGLNPVPILND